MKIFAHRGASRDAPENTLAAFREGWRQGADGAELDVHLSRDGEIIVCHDPDTRRTTGRKLVIANSTAAELRKLDAGRGEHLPLLAEVFQEMPGDRQLLVEVKCGAEIIPALQRMNTPDVAVGFLCFDRAVLTELKRALPEFRCLLNVEPPTALARYEWTELIDRCLACSLDGVSLGWHGSVTNELVKQIHAADLRVAVWTVDDPTKAARAHEAGVDLLMTNEPAKIIESLRRRDTASS